MNMLSIITIVSLIIILLVSLYSIKKYKQNSLGDKYITVICAVVGAIAAVVSISSETVINNHQSNNNISNQNGTVVISDGNVTVETSVIGATRESILLADAEISLKIGDYEKAFLILSDDSLADDSKAQVDLAYMYAHGYGVPRDINKALAMYDESELIQAKRNKLALLIATDFENRIDDIEQLIDYFIGINDIEVWNYLLSCTDMVLDDTLNNSDSKLNFTFSLNDLKQYEAVEQKTFSNPPTDTGYEIYRFVGSDFPQDGSSYSLQLFTYEVYRLKYIDIIDHFAIEK